MDFHRKKLPREQVLLEISSIAKFSLLHVSRGASYKSICPLRISFSFFLFLLPSFWREMQNMQFISSRINVWYIIQKSKEKALLGNLIFILKTVNFRAIEWSDEGRWKRKLQKCLIMCDINNSLATLHVKTFGHKEPKRNKGKTCFPFLHINRKIK